MDHELLDLDEKSRPALLPSKPIIFVWPSRHNVVYRESHRRRVLSCGVAVCGGEEERGGFSVVAFC